MREGRRRSFGHCDSRIGHRSRGWSCRTGLWRAHPATIDAIRLAGALEGLVLDPVYTGKGLAGLIAMIRTGRWNKDQNVIFVHTGGAPALFAYESVLGI